MVTRRRASGRRGSGYRAVTAAAALGSLNERLLRRQLSTISRQISNELSTVHGVDRGQPTGQQVIATLPVDVSRYHHTGRPMSELFGMPNLRKYLLFHVSF